MPAVAPSDGSGMCAINVRCRNYVFEILTHDTRLITLLLRQDTVYLVEHGTVSNTG